MHEFSLIQSLLDSCQDYAQREGADRITTIRVRIGLMAGVEPELFQRAFETFRQDTCCHNATMEIQWQPLLLHCQHCQQESRQDTPRYLCQHCHSSAVTVLAGEDIMLMQLEME
ncbi:hydrogenase maturation nickel metallochaperone HypA [Desulfurispira natronophila]|uniref:Hydrogenase maturation factor HypA n=1 Tax=Desulfurispira natronophila TaxID=682562 RepID=A0A7W7Y2W4_9BACT|nr:hydrogenase maturation nickel metallochaperone HypA [Desulfurispira natronophila]MBB5021110.1 hydrogenase nickel incorporation protein HypA/HybF [Desulfurispira natronophila]